MANETLEVRIVGVDEVRQLDRALEELSRRLDNARGDATRTQAALLTTANSFDSLAKEASKAASSITKVSDKGLESIARNGNAASTALRETERAMIGVGASAAAIARNTTQVGQSSQEFDKYGNAASKTERQVRGLDDALEDLGEEVKRTGAGLNALGSARNSFPTANVSALNAGLANTTTAANQAGSSLGFLGTIGASAIGDAANESEDFVSQAIASFGRMRTSLIAGNARIAASLGITAGASAALLGGVAVAGVAVVGAFAIASSSVSAFIEKTEEGKNAVAPMRQAIDAMQMSIGRTVTRSKMFKDTIDLMTGAIDYTKRALTGFFEGMDAIYGIVKNVVVIVAGPTIGAFKLLMEGLLLVQKASNVVLKAIEDLTDILVDAANFVRNQFIDAFNGVISVFEDLAGATDGAAGRFERFERTVEGAREPIVEMERGFRGVLGSITAVNRVLELNIAATNQAREAQIGLVRQNPIIRHMQDTSNVMTRLNEVMNSFWINQETAREENNAGNALDAIREAAERALEKVKELNTALQETLSGKDQGKKDPNARFEDLKPGAIAAIQQRELRALVENQIQQRIKQEEGPTYLPPNFPLENPFLNTDGPKITGQRGAPIPRAAGYDPKLDPKMARTIAEALSDAIKPGEAEVVRVAREAMVSIAQSTQNALGMGGVIGRDQIEARAAIVNPPPDRSDVAGRQSGADYLMPQFQASYFRNTRGNNPRMDELARIEDNAREMLRTGEISIELFRSFVTSGIATVDGLEEYLQQNASPERLALFGTAKEAATYTREVTDDFYGRGINSSLSEKDRGMERIQAREALGSMSSEAFGLDISPWVRGAESVREYTEALKQMSQVQKDSLKLGVDFGTAFANSTKAGLGAAAASSESFADTFRAAMGAAIISEGVSMAWKGAGQLLLGNPIGAAQMTLGAGMILAGRAMGGTGAGPAPSAAAASETVNQGQNTQISVLNNFGFVGDRRAATREISAAMSESRRRGLR